MIASEVPSSITGWIHSDEGWPRPFCILMVLSYILNESSVTDIMEMVWNYSLEH